MKTKDEILDWALMQDEGSGYVSKAMDEFAKQQSVAFLKWHTDKYNEYVAVMNSKNPVSGETWIECNRFAKSTIEGRYNLFIENQNA